MSVTDHPTGTPALIEETSGIDAPWIAAALAAGGIQADVRAITTTPIGAGNVSDTRRVDIEYADRPADAPDSVVVKFRPTSPETHAHGLGSGAYHREIGAYRAIGERAACRIPHAYWVAGDETNINLVVEDLTGTTVAGNQVAGCSPVEAEAVLTQLARLHASFSPMDPATAPAWPIRMAEAADYWEGATRTGADAALARYRGRLSDDDLAIVDAAGDLVRRWYTLPQTRLTLSHGDPRVDNVLFETVDGAPGAVLIDWQVTGLRNPMYDVGYFLSGSLSVDDRRAHEPRLIEHYLDTFAAITPGYSADEAREDYRTQVLSGLMISTAAIAVLPDVDVVNTLICALLERNCAAARDWGAIEAVRAS